MEATFSEPMKLSDGKTIQPTGKKVKMPMATIARWKNGCIATAATKPARYLT